MFFSDNTDNEASHPWATLREVRTSEGTDEAVDEPLSSSPPPCSASSSSSSSSSTSEVTEVTEDAEEAEDEEVLELALRFLLRARGLHGDK